MRSREREFVLAPCGPDLPAATWLIETPKSAPMSVKPERRAPYIGRPLPRLEDARLISGQGRYTDDTSFADQACAVFVRSTHPHARILAIDRAAARAMPGIIAVLAADDYAASGARGVMHNANPADTIDYKVKAFGKRGTPLELPHLPFAMDRVRYVGEPVALVVAATLAAARGAAEAVIVAYEVLPAVIDVRAAIASGARGLFDSAPHNIA